MKLTKYIPVAIFSVLLMVSCGRDDEKCERVITDKPILYGTGGTRLADSQFENGDVFSVWANYRVDGETERYISGQQVTLRGNKWTQDENYYWPMGGSLDFYAVYPSPETCRGKKNEITLNADAVVPALRYKINDFSEDIDLLAAKSPALSCPYANLVPLHFKHLLGRMRLKVTNKCEFGIPLDVHITSMSISAKANAEGDLDWATMTMIPTDNQLNSFNKIESDFQIKANQTFTVGTYYIIPGMVKDFNVTASWEILNSGAVAATYTGVKGEFFSEYQADSGKVLEVNFVLRRKDGSNNDVTVDIEN